MRWFTLQPCVDGETRGIIFTRLHARVRRLAALGYTGQEKFLPLVNGDHQCIAEHQHTVLPLDEFVNRFGERVLKVYLVYSALRDGKTLEAWPSDRYVAETLNLTLKQVEKDKKKLRDLNLISKEYRTIKRDKETECLFDTKAYTVFGHLYADYMVVTPETKTRILNHETIKSKAESKAARITAYHYGRLAEKLSAKKSEETDKADEQENNATGTTTSQNLQNSDGSQNFNRAGGTFFNAPSDDLGPQNPGASVVSPEAGNNTLSIKYILKKRSFSLSKYTDRLPYGEPIAAPSAAMVKSLVSPRRVRRWVTFRGSTVKGLNLTLGFGGPWLNLNLFRHYLQKNFLG